MIHTFKFRKRCEVATEFRMVTQLWCRLPLLSPIGASKVTNLYHLLFHALYVYISKSIVAVKKNYIQILTVLRVQPPNYENDVFRMPFFVCLSVRIMDVRLASS
jgi:hypothetical protein